MSAWMTKALQSYKAQDYKGVLVAMGPHLPLPQSLSNELLLLAAQAYAKSGQPKQAAAFYTLAAERGGPQEAMLRTLAANMLREADESRAALSQARDAAKATLFDAYAQESYRRYLRDFLCLDEAMMDDQRVLDQMRRGDARYLRLEFQHNHISWCADEAINARQTRMHASTAFTAETRRARRAFPHSFDKKIRVGYLSADFSDQHPTMRLLQGVLSAHDSAAFDITLFCYTPDDLIKRDCGMRASYPDTIRIGHLTDEEAAQCIREKNIDVLVDLMGHTKGARIGLINLGAAPVQAAFLGYAGSGIGIDCDYAMTDAIVTPESSKPFYHEKLCRLPDTYQPNDNRYRPLPPPALRQDIGLPEDKFVFASFNGARKVTAHTAQLWARILAGTDESVLWMMCADSFARENFLHWMREAGISADRIIFAAPAAYGDHVARLQAADLALDTFPYNGHTTSSDALWAGLPVATYRGRHFASRVTESLLRAVALPELVADDARAYVALCISLAQAPERLRLLREKLAANRTTTPLFDTVRFTRHLESAFTLMVDRAKAGLEPDHIDVPRL